jgi:hypothetical protein
MVRFAPPIGVVAHTAHRFVAVGHTANPGRRGPPAAAQRWPGPSPKLPQKGQNTRCPALLPVRTGVTGAERVRPMRTWGKCLAPLARARLPGQGRRSLSYRLDPPANQRTIFGSARKAETKWPAGPKRPTDPSPIRLASPPRARIARRQSTDLTGVPWLSPLAAYRRTGTRGVQPAQVLLALSARRNFPVGCRSRRR